MWCVWCVFVCVGVCVGVCVCVCVLWWRLVAVVFVVVARWLLLGVLQATAGVAEHRPQPLPVGGGAQAARF